MKAAWLLSLAIVLLLSIGSAGDPVTQAGTEKTRPGESTGQISPLLATNGAVVAKGAASDLRPMPIMPMPRPMNVGLEVLVDGRPQPTVRHQGTTYLPVSRLGAEYEIRVWNHGPKRVAAIVSVDGLSAIDGQPASEDRAGYIIAPYGHILIKGWRRNMDSVAAFRFVDREKSYANLVGRPENLGVIGLAAFEELTSWPYPELDRRAAPAAAANRFRTEAGSVGTEYGREIDSRIHFVDFVRSANRQTIAFYYDTPESLRRKGVPIDLPNRPNPFPGDPPKFAPPPPGYPNR